MRAGARLGEAEKKRLSALNQELAQLFTQFSQNLLADETDQWLVIEKEAELLRAGLEQELGAELAEQGQRARQHLGIAGLGHHAQDVAGHQI